MDTISWACVATGWSDLFSLFLSREEARKDPQFLIREGMARSKDIVEPVKLLQELESYPNDQVRLRQCPG